jgi:hypothetical protein
MRLDSALKKSSPQYISAQTIPTLHDAIMSYYIYVFIIYIFRPDQFSLLLYRCFLPSSATVKMDYEENMENARYATNDDTPL